MDRATTTRAQQLLESLETIQGDLAAARAEAEEIAALAEDDVCAATADGDARAVAAERGRATVEQVASLLAQAESDTATALGELEELLD